MSTSSKKKKTSVEGGIKTTSYSLLPQKILMKRALRPTIEQAKKKNKKGPSR